jgi:colicin import membrane protein
MSEALMSDLIEAPPLSSQPDDPDGMGEAAGEPVFALTTVATLVPKVVFAPGGVDKLLTALETEVRAQAGALRDISQPKNRKAITSLAYKVARSKTALDDMGKDLGAEWKRLAGLVDADRRNLRERLEALQAEVRAPLDRYEAEEEKRKAEHEAAIAAILAMGETEGMTAEQIAERQWTVPSNDERAWQEYAFRADEAINSVVERLATAHEAAVQREAAEAEAAAAHAAEAARIAAENEAARIAHEAQIAENARAVAIMEADAAAERERQAAALALAEAEAKTAAALAAAEQAAKQAEADKVAAAAKAEADAAAAVEEERQRVASVQAAEAAEADRRARSKAHRQRINAEVLADMHVAIKDIELPPETAAEVLKAVIIAIARGGIRHVELTY